MAEYPSGLRGRIANPLFAGSNPASAFNLGPAGNQKEDRMSRVTIGVAAKAAGLVLVAMASGLLAAAVDHSHEGPPQPWSKFKVHDMERPRPPVVSPGTFSTADKPGQPPSDAI